ncbi:helix-turn-helix transcriptional regulator [Methylophilus sp. DW102]|uniref:helix-turn-helix domain-containing protein n=1 Tax=Methylophilus sp. DW102 TaxID=3095607 RepID=UPI00308F021C|nr:helix-turn-helix domain-containing protein [Methylophilus sp. DW102]
MSIGMRLKEERERLHLEQEAVYTLAGISRQSYGSYENDRSLPKADFLAAIASIGFDIGYIITGLRAENVAHTPTELGYLRHCRLLATKGLAKKGLDGLVFLRESNGIKIDEMPSAYQAANDSLRFEAAQDKGDYKEGE